MLENRVEKLGDKLKIALAYASPLGVSTVKKILANISVERLMSVDLERFFFFHATFCYRGTNYCSCEVSIIVEQFNIF